MEESILVKTEVIQSLIEHNDELENYFRNTILPQFYVEANLILKKFTLHNYFNNR